MQGGKPGSHSQRGASFDSKWVLDIGESKHTVPILA